MITKEKIMDIYSLHRDGFKVDAIAKKLGLNWRTVNKYIENNFERKKYDTSSRTSQLAPYYPIIENWLEDDTYTAAWMYDRLKLMGYEGGYDQVRRKVRKVKDNLTMKAYIRFETEPGRQAQVDFGEFQVVDDNWKRVATLYLFSMILGYSRDAYHEFITSRDMTSFLDCHINAFEYFGGVPQEIVYDRMKNVLIRQLAGKLEWNKEFYSFCLHYRYKPLVAPPYAAWVKGKVERPMHYVRENFWRGYAYHDREQANRDLFDWMITTRSRVHGTTHERVDHRFDREKLLLGKVPEHWYDTSLKVYRKVRKDCTVMVGGNVYVLPHRSVGNFVLLKIKNGMMAAYLDKELLVSYQIPEGKGNFVQDKRFYRELKADSTQINRKYRGKSFLKGKARKTLGITGDFSDSITVAVRSIDEYRHIAEDTPWHQ